MGCDIHSYLQKRNQETGNWEAIKDPYWGDLTTVIPQSSTTTPSEYCGGECYNHRNYYLFGILTNGYVRVDVPLNDFLYYPRDLPEDIGKNLNECFTGVVYLHSVSYLTVDEIYKIYTQLRRHIVLDNAWANFTNIPEDLIAPFHTIPENERNNYRIVFAFDC